MDLDGGRSISKQDSFLSMVNQTDFQNQGGASWVPVTPVKPIVQRPEPIHADRHNNSQQLDDANWGRVEVYSFGLTRENQAVPGFDSTNCYEVNRGVNNRGGDSTGKVADSGGNANGNGQACVDPWQGWNTPFTDLLNQATQGSSAPLDRVMAPTSPFDFGYSPQTGGSWQESTYASSCPLTQNLSPGSKQWNDFTFTPQMTQCNLPIPGRQVYDLNMLPGMIADDLPSDSVLQFAPITNTETHCNVHVATSRVNIIELHQEQMLSEAADSSFPTVSTAIAENNTPEKGTNQVFDLNATPQQKQRRRKHRPKVIREGKKKAQTPAVVNKSQGLKEDPTVKRKYVRKKRFENPSTASPPPEVSVESSDPKQFETAKKSARRVLNFGLGENPAAQATVQNCQVTANKLGTSEQKIAKPDVHSEWLIPNDSNNSATETAADRQATAKKRHCDDIFGMDDPRAVNLTGSQHSSAFHVEDLGGKSTGMCIPDICKKRRTEKGQCSTTSSTSSSTTAKNAAFLRQRLLSCSNARVLELNNNNCASASQLQTGRERTTQAETVQVAMDRMQAFECMLSLGDKDRLTKKRSKVPTRVRGLGSLVGMAESKLIPAFSGKQLLFSNEVQGAAASSGPQNCIEALVAESSAKVARRKRSQKLNSLRSSVSSSTNSMNLHQYNTLPLQVMWKQMFSVDAIIERFKRLNINTGTNMVSCQEYSALVPYKKENHQSQNALVPYKKKKEKSQNAHFTYQEQNALVIYGRDGTLVPFDGPFYPIKKRRPRPKVDLDDETSKVWRLLLENINNEGIDGSDEQRAKWWEEERRVFRGRADSFIARMHLVQGDRRFSKWKGSVVDSVVGVFLTQNVSDHLSSSAFMSMAAHFPLKSKSRGEQWNEDGMGILVEEPELCILDHEDIIKWKEKMPLNLDCDQSSTMPNDPGKNEEKELINSHDSVETGTDGGTSCVIGDGTITEDVISSQSSVDSSMAQTAERRQGQCSENNPELHDPTTMPTSTSLISSTSFVELLQIAEAPKFNHNHNHKIFPGVADKIQVYIHNQPATYDEQSRTLNRFDGPESSLVESITYSYSVQTPSSRSQEVDRIEGLEEESRSSEVSCKKDENMMSNINRFTEASSSRAIYQEKLSVSVPELLLVPQDNFQSNKSFTIERNEKEQTWGKPYGDNNQRVELLIQRKTNDFQQNKSPNFSEISDITESTSALNIKKNTEQKGAEPYLNEQNYSCVTGLNDTAADTTTLKRKRVVKEKAPGIDWDNLRKQAQANGPREKTANTMDSVDWEAVRCADVGEIAHTIRERGMNNMLAERIKAFLNRLLNDHGSLDLEWLRDVPPDKAKEYLLSIRGLGLKSVECIRLLTLHHLAFPVDTNVGRIAVRLGWVPLQPLPESLQLHLLELYPVLESIQKYLWPRLCKLDQRTLYELHYQMITFGKVFCTKSKPNCNACPMRGECRHFASAFASARLALPGPEEKGIVVATENQAPGENLAVITNTLRLPQPQVDHHSTGNSQIEENQSTEAKYGTSNNEPIIEEPQTPEPENVQILECDIEDICLEEDPDEIPTIQLNIEEFTQNLQDYMQKNMELQDGDMSRALVALTPELASLPAPKLKYISRLRTEHQVYELPDSHPLLLGLDRREPDDPCSYLLAIWTPGETIDSIQPPERNCRSQENGELCAETTCFSCNSIREASTQTVRGTLLIPCRTAMRGSFPLNGTYFQVNEVFADHDSSLNPIDVPRAWLWNLPRRTVYFGTSIPTIFKGLTTEGIQYCFWRGFVCVRGFDQKSRAPRPLIARLHFPASRLVRTTKGKPNDE